MSTRITLEQLTHMQIGEIANLSQQEIQEPTAPDLRVLKKAVAPHKKIFEDLYRPIRHEVFAHKILKDGEAVSALFGQAKIKDMEETLFFLHDLLSVLAKLYHDGTLPKFGDSRAAYTEHTEHVKNVVRNLLAKAAGI